MSAADAMDQARLTSLQKKMFHVFISGPVVIAIGLLSWPSTALAHKWHTHGHHKGHHSHAHSNTGGEVSSSKHVDGNQTPAATSSTATPAQAKTPPQVSLAGPQAEVFEPFAENVTAHVDGQYLVVESNGLPSHQMMVGIVAWQQQVPIPQPFLGDNAWRFPLHPKPADEPISVLKNPLSGAIALAVNGVPIFCALNNRGEDTLLAGELDEWGGHCGRGDDYHYHAAPVHLEKQVGVGNPIGYALDGYPILGFTEADGSTPTDLDKFNGHKDADGNYHYHATKNFPYINGGLMGVVTMDGNQVKQPRDLPTRPSLPPLKGATITGFSQNGNHYDLAYEVDGETSHVKYSLLEGDKVEFSFVDPNGKTTKKLYERGRANQFAAKQIFVIVGLLLVGVFATIALTRKFKRTSKSS